MNFSTLRTRLCLLLAFSLFFVPLSALAAAAKKPKKAAVAQEYPPYLIGPGDLLNITIYGEKDLPTLFLVDSTGTIVFPLAGEVNVAGYSQSEAGKQLAGRLHKYQKNPQVTVLIQETNTFNISVLGSVVKPGKYRVRGVPTLLSMLGEAGGPLDSASLSNAMLIRGEKKTPLNLNDYLGGSGLYPQPVLFPGDVIMVPKSPWPTISEWGIIAGIITSGILISNSLAHR